MEKHEVVPCVIDKVPKEVAEVIYRNGVKADLGNELTTKQTEKPPKVHWSAEADSYYTLCMTDPDAPSREDPKYREWHHWLVGNIPGLDLAKGEIISEYIGPGPPKKTGLHRYVILIYKQPGKLKFKEPRLSNKAYNGREKFSIMKFAMKYNLGDPIAGNFFLAQWGN